MNVGLRAAHYYQVGVGADAFAPEASVPLGSSAPTVRKSIGHLAELGFVREPTARQRGRLFVYQAYLDLLAKDTEPL